MSIKTFLSNSGVPQLLHISDDVPGYTRLATKDGFDYLCPEKKPIKDDKIIQRLNELVLPPAWTDVWICINEKGYLQATGRDEKGRKQYRYHPDWTAYQQAEKFSRMPGFVEALVAGRPKIQAILQDKSLGWTRLRVAALAVAILDETGMRIGNHNYHRRNGTVGLTTVRRKHMEVDENHLHFFYVGKSSQDREVAIEDPELIRLVQNMSELPGYQVFRYKGQDGKMHNVDSSEVNTMIHEVVGENYSAKDFRTWTGTAAAVEYYSDAQTDAGENSRRRIDTLLVGRVADFLGNTPTICRKYYIHPLVMAAVESAEVPTYKDICKNYSKAFVNELDEGELVAYHLIKGR